MGHGTLFINIPLGLGEIRMETVTVTSDYQVNIPDSIRKALGIEPGQAICLIEYKGVVRMVPIMDVAHARGFLKGVDAHIEREPDRL